MSMQGGIPFLTNPSAANPSGVIYPPTRPPPTPTPAGPVPGVPGSTGLSPAQQDAVAYLQSLLEDYGLGSLSGWAYDQVVAGNSPEMILQELRKRPEYRQRFWVIEERRKRGLSAISPAEIIAYERQGRQLFRAAGLPEGFYDSTDDLQRFLLEDVSMAELNDRVELGREWLYGTDAQTRSELTRLYGEGNLLAWALDEDVAVPLIQRQFNAARSAASSFRTGYGALSRGEAERLVDLGIDPNQAAAAFADLVGSRELFGALPGEAAQDITREEQLAAAFEQNAEARGKIDKRARTRRAAFAGGGGFATDREGYAGLGTLEG